MMVDWYEDLAFFMVENNFSQQYVDPNIANNFDTEQYKCGYIYFDLDFHKNLEYFFFKKSFFIVSSFLKFIKSASK